MVAGAALVGTLLAGCTGGGRTASPSGSPSSSLARTAVPPATSSPSPSPTSAQARAYAGATAAFKRFANVLYEVERDSGKHPERLRQVSTGDALELAELVARSYRSDGFRMVGTPALTHIKPRSYSAVGRTAVVRLSACEGGGGAYAVDRSGKRIRGPRNAPHYGLYDVTVMSASGSAWIVSDFTSKGVFTCS
jgi:hypothetical protein